MTGVCDGDRSTECVAVLLESSRPRWDNQFMLRTPETGDVGVLDSVTVSLIPSGIETEQSEQICLSRWSESMVLAASVGAIRIGWRCCCSESGCKSPVLFRRRIGASLSPSARRKAQACKLAVELGCPAAGKNIQQALSNGQAPFDPERPGWT